MKRSIQTLIIIIAVITIFNGCSKDMVHPAASGLNSGTKQINTTGSITVSPANGIVFSAATITGTGFSTTAANNVVKFNGVTAVVNLATATQIVATVPAGATTGTVTVTANSTTSTSASNFHVLQMVKVDSTTIDNAVTHKGIDFTLTASDKKGNLYGIGTGQDFRSGGSIDFIFKYSNGKSTRLYTAPGVNSFYTLTSLIIDARGNLYAAQEYHYNNGPWFPIVDSAEILKITPNGQVSVFAGGNPGIKDSNGGNTTQAMFVYSMISDAQGNLYAAVNAALLKKITPTGVVTTVTGFNAAYISSMITDKLGNLYYEVGESSSSSPTGVINSLKKRTPQGNTSTIFTQYYPFSMVIDPYNNIFASVDYFAVDEVQNVYVINQANAANLFPPPNGPLYPFRVLADVNGNLLTESEFSGITVWNFK